MASDFIVEIDERSVYAVLDSALNDGVTQDNLDTLADQALDFQKDTVPVDTGDLKSVLEIRNTPDEQGRQVGVFENNAKGVDYGIAVEAGWTTKNGRPIPAQPYIAPSVNAVTG